MPITTRWRARRPRGPFLRPVTAGAAALVVAGMALAGCSSSSVMHMRVGQCIQKPEADTVSTVDTVDCSTPHYAEVFLIHEVEGDGEDFPGNSLINDTALSVCVQNFEAYVGSNYVESSLDARWIIPNKDSWRRKERKIVCLVVDMQGGKLSQSVKNSGL